MSETTDSASHKGITNIFTRSRNRDPSKRNSTHGSIRSFGSDNVLGLRRSIDALNDVANVHEDEEAHGVKKLVDKTIGRRKRKKQEAAEEQLANEEAERGRSIVERGTLKDDVDAAVLFTFDAKVNTSQSSLVTLDNEPTNTRPEKPLLSTHPSHTGYLTSSSPLVQTTSIPRALTAESQINDTHTPRTSIFPASMSKLSTSDSHPSLRAPENESHRRSPSPVGRLRDALKTKKSFSPNTSPERKLRGASGVGGSTISLGAESTPHRRGSVSSRLGHLFPEKSQTAPVVQQQQPPTSTPERPRTAKISTTDLSATPSTPPAGDVAPTIVNTPPTPTDFSTPRFPSASRDRGSSDPLTSTVITSPSGNMISHRRVRSGSASLGPSKLSSIQSAPLTPTPEHPSPGPSNQTGFFSSVFSAAQNVTNTLNNITTLAPGNKTKIASQSDTKEVENPIVETLSEKTNGASDGEQKELAVKTLGMGDLSLSHLGISENSVTNTPTSTRFPHEVRGRSETVNTYDDPYTSRSALGAPFSMHEGAETGSTSNFDDSIIVRPRSFYGGTSAGERTPPPGSIFEGKSGVQRSGSIRSAVGNRRKRNSSAATNGGFGTIGAAIAAANGSIARPNAPGEGPKITGFAVASKKRNRDFHQLFRSVPDDDYLIEDYSCAIQKDILVHGRLYISEGHMCFSSNILGWVTTLVMSFDEIVSVEKRNTALVFRNALMISTLVNKHTFASFTSRDSTYDLLIGIWKLGHPSLRSTLNGQPLDEAGGDKTEKYDAKAESHHGSASGSESENGSGEDVYDEDEDGSDEELDDGSAAGSDNAAKVVSRKTSAAVVGHGAAPEITKSDTPPTTSTDFPGPSTHAPTTCTDGDTHYPKVVADEVIAAPLGKVYNLLFGPPSVLWMKDWFANDQKCTELNFEDLALTQDNKTRGYTYIKPLPGAIGPRQTKCICTETLDHLDLERSVSVSVSTITPDVPSGNVFSTKTRYCLTWAEGNATRLQMNCVIEWTGKSWLKGPIEKGANDGQTKHGKDLIAAVRAGLTTRPRAATGLSKGKKKGRKSGVSKNTNGAIKTASSSTPTPSDWGLFEPLHGILGPVVDIAGPILTGNVLYGLLVGLLVASWFRFGGTGGRGGRDVGMFTTPERVAAYEEIWRREESELWDWLEDRVGLRDIVGGGMGGSGDKGLKGGMGKHAMDMNGRMVDDALRVTEEKLGVLKRAVEEKKRRRLKENQKTN